MESKLPYLNNTAVREEFQFQNTVRGRTIYMIAVIMLFLFIGLLPVIKVPLSVQGRGIIRPMQEKTGIICPVSGKISALYITESQRVQEGDTLLTIKSSAIKAKRKQIFRELTKVQEFLKDLDILCAHKQEFLSSSLYSGQLSLYNNKNEEFEMKIRQALRERNRGRELYQKSIISSKAFEELEFELVQLQKQQEVLQSQFESQWHADRVDYRKKEEELLKQLTGIKQEEEMYCIKAPVSGTIEEFSGIHAGSILQAGQKLGVISPESEKIAEIYISAQNIGYLNENQEVKIQVDAYNYNDWGSIPARIKSVSKDYILADGQPAFRVKCVLAQDYLKLRNGTKGSIRKGMTISAHFQIANRTLFQLLYQKADDWFNPSRTKSP